MESLLQLERFDTHENAGIGLVIRPVGVEPVIRETDGGIRGRWPRVRGSGCVVVFRVWPLVKERIGRRSFASEAWPSTNAGVALAGGFPLCASESVVLFVRFAGVQRSYLRLREPEVLCPLFVGQVGGTGGRIEPTHSSRGPRLHMTRHATTRLACLYSQFLGKQELWRQVRVRTTHDPFQLFPLRHEFLHLRVVALSSEETRRPMSRFIR